VRRQAKSESDIWGFLEKESTNVGRNVAFQTYGPCRGLDFDLVKVLHIYGLQDGDFILLDFGVVRWPLVECSGRGSGWAMFAFGRHGQVVTRFLVPLV
jgi:hypothetical protein